MTVLSAWAWPVVALIGLLILRKPLSDLFSRLGGFPEKGWWPWFYPPGSRSPAAIKSESERVKKDFIGNIYWSGADLMTAFASVIRGDRDSAVRELSQANHHLHEGGLGDAPAQIRLAKLLKEISESIQANWTPDKRRQYLQDIHSIAGEVGKVFEAAQGESFRATPR